MPAINFINGHCERQKETHSGCLEFVRSKISEKYEYHTMKGLDSLMVNALS